jgi:hypothetical protein
MEISTRWQPPQNEVLQKQHKNRSKRQNDALIKTNKAASKAAKATGDLATGRRGESEAYATAMLETLEPLGPVERMASASFFVSRAT